MGLWPACTNISIAVNGVNNFSGPAAAGVDGVVAGGLARVCHVPG